MLGVIDRFADQSAPEMHPPVDLSNTLPFHVICLAYPFVVVHRFHLLYASGFLWYRSYATVGSFYFTKNIQQGFMATTSHTMGWINE